MNIFTYNMRNACARLGNNFLIVNTRNRFQDMLLVTLENMFYCEYNMDAEYDPVVESEKKSHEIIDNYIRKYNLNFALVGNNTFNIVISELRTISP